MKRALLLFLAAGFAFGAYQGYYYIDPLTSVDTTKWYKNGIVSATPSGLTSTSASGGSLISKLAVPDGTSDYHVSTDLRLPMSGGTYYHYLRASADAKAGPTPTGSFYSVELRNPTFNGSSCTATLAVQKRVGGVLTLLASTTIPC